MSVLSIGLLYGASTLLVMFAGMPIAFALGAVATLFMIAFMPSSSVDTITQNVYEEMASITLLSIPLFILKGAAIGQSRAGQGNGCAPHGVDLRAGRRRAVLALHGRPAVLLVGHLLPRLDLVHVECD